MWLLVIVAFALGDGPDFAFDRPITESVESEDDCHVAAKTLAMEAWVDAQTTVSFVYKCVPPTVEGRVQWGYE